MTGQEYRELPSESARKGTKSRTDMDLQLKEDERMEKFGSQEEKEIWEQIEANWKMLERLDEKCGGITAGMAFPSMEKVLWERFHMEAISVRLSKRKYGRTMEMDVFAYSASKGNEAIIVEVRKHLKERDLERMLQLLGDFSQFFPEHRDKRLFGVLACADAPDYLEQRVLQSGIYLAKIHEETFRIQVPEGFVAKSYQN